MFKTRHSVYCLALICIITVLSGCSGESDTINTETYTAQTSNTFSSFVSSSTAPSSTSDIQSSSIQESVSDNSETSQKSSAESSAESSDTSAVTSTVPETSVSNTSTENYEHEYDNATYEMPSYTEPSKIIEEPSTYVSTYEPEIEPEKSSSLPQADWRTAYKEQLNKVYNDYYSNTSMMFNLLDVDKDGCPELFISYAQTVAGGGDLYSVCSIIKQFEIV